MLLTLTNFALLLPAQGGGVDVASVPDTLERLTAKAAETFLPKSLAPDYVAQIERLETVLRPRASIPVTFCGDLILDGG
jgi:hypothetical protein